MDVKIEGALAWIDFGRPEKLNAFNANAWCGLKDAISRAGDDAAVRAIGLRGSAKAFCAGNDVTEFFGLNDAAASRHYFLEVVMPSMEAILTCAVPVICAVRGLAFGGGSEIVLMSDLAVAGPGARFRLPEARIGVWPTVFAALAPYTLGHKASGFLALTTLEQDAESALRLGLVHEVVDDDDVEDRVRALAAMMARGSRDAVQRTKRYTTAVLRTDGMNAVRAALSELAEETIGSPDAREGIASFREHRPPAFARPGAQSKETRQ